MDLGLLMMIVWAMLSWRLLWDNMEVLNSVSLWRSCVATVLLVICAPVFFLSDLGEVVLDLVVGEEEDGE